MDKITIIDISIWEMDLDYPENHGKYRLAVTLLNAGSVVFGPFFQKKKQAEKYLSKCKSMQLVGFDEGYAWLRMIVEKFKKNNQ